MVNVIIIAKHACICPVCHGNGFIRVATGDTSKDFRDNSKVEQCEQCNSSGELEIQEPTIEFLEAMVTTSRLQ